MTSGPRTRSTTRLRRAALLAAAALLALLLPAAGAYAAPASQKLASGGQIWIAESNVRQKHDLDPVSWWGHDYLHARYYSNTLGRFLSLDTVGGSPQKGSQGWNRYTYARDNPLRLVDLDGADPGDAFGTLALAATDAHYYVRQAHGYELEYGTHIFRLPAGGFSYMEPYTSGQEAAWNPMRPVGYSLQDIAGGVHGITALFHTHTNDLTENGFFFTAADISTLAGWGIPGFVGTPADNLVQWTPNVDPQTGTHMAAGTQTEITHGEMSLGGNSVQFAEEKKSSAIRGVMVGEHVMRTEDGKLVFVTPGG